MPDAVITIVLTHGQGCWHIERGPSSPCTCGYEERMRYERERRGGASWRA